MNVPDQSVRTLKKIRHPLVKCSSKTFQQKKLDILMHLNLNFLLFLVGPLCGAFVRQAPKFTGDFGGKPCNARPVIDVLVRVFYPSW